MIIDKPQLPGDEVELIDAPPAYDALVASGSAAPRPQLVDEKTAGPSSSSLYSTPNTLAPRPPNSPNGLSSPSTKRSPGWFASFQRARTAREVKSTVAGLIHDLVTKPYDSQSDGGALGILQSCADACAAYDLSLSTLLQEPTLERRTPLYWAIANRPSPTVPPEEDQADLVTTLLAHSTPLTAATVSEIRLACVQTGDQALYARLRRCGAFAPLTRTEEIVVGDAAPPDEVEIEDVDGDEGAFVARMWMPMFQKRMRISKAVRVEFIARGASCSTAFRCGVS